MSLKKIEDSKYRPSKKLMDHVGNVIKGKSEYILLDEQLIIYDKVLARAKKAFMTSKRQHYHQRGARNGKISDCHKSDGRSSS